MPSATVDYDRQLLRSHAKTATIKCDTQTDAISAALLGMAVTLGNKSPDETVSARNGLPPNTATQQATDDLSYRIRPNESSRVTLSDLVHRTPSCALRPELHRFAVTDTSADGLLVYEQCCGCGQRRCSMRGDRLQQQIDARAVEIASAPGVRMSSPLQRLESQLREAVERQRLRPAIVDPVVIHAVRPAAQPPAPQVSQPAESPAASVPGKKRIVRL